jgi:1-deoxy-D-xylulose-5-phosphate synthase
VKVDRNLEVLPVGRGEVRRTSKAPVGRRIALLAFGSMLAPALAAAARFDATVANMRFVKPLDLELLRELAESHNAIVTIEESAVAGGAGSACLEALAAMGLERPALQLGLPDRFIDHGDTALLLRECGLDPEGIARAIDSRLMQRLAPPLHRKRSAA